jgi:hypothetical protein
VSLAVNRVFFYQIDTTFHQMYHGFHQIHHQMRQVCQVFHQVSIVVTSVVFTHDSELRLKNLI